MVTLDTTATSGLTTTTLTTASSGSINKPTAAATGEYLLAAISVRVGSAPTAAPIGAQSGWTTIRSTGSNGTANSPMYWIGYKKVEAGEPSSYTFDWSSISATYSNTLLAMVRVTGADATTFLDTGVTSDGSWAGGSSPYTLDPASVTTTVNNALLVSVFLGKPGNTLINDDTIIPTGFTKVLRQGAPTWTSSSGAQIAIAYKEQATAGASGAVSWPAGSTAAGYHNAVLFAIRPSTETLPTISDVGDEVFSDGESGLPITGSTFGASQGSGSVHISPTDSVGDGGRVAQTVTAWSDTSITFTAESNNNRYGVPWYLFVTNDSGQSNSSGFQVSWGPPTGKSWVDANVPWGGSAYSVFQSCSPAVVDGDQLEYDSLTNLGAAVSMQTDGTFYLSSGTGTHTFSCRVFDATDSTWGTPYTVTVGPDSSVTTVPDLDGLTSAAAASAITAAGLVVGTVSYDYSAVVPITEVISQSPAPGLAVEEGTAVNYQVSLGAQPAGAASEKLTVYVLASGAGLRRWVDYLPVKIGAPTGRMDSYDDNGAISVKVIPSNTGLTAWVDYLPVVDVADTDTTKWTFNDAGWIPMYDEG